MIKTQRFREYIKKFNYFNEVEKARIEKYGQTKIVLRYTFDYDNEHFNVYFTKNSNISDNEIADIIKDNTQPLTNIFIVTVQNNKILKIRLCFIKIEGTVSNMSFNSVYYKLKEDDIKDFNLEKYKYSND